MGSEIESPRPKELRIWEREDPHTGTVGVGGESLRRKLGEQSHCFYPFTICAARPRFQGKIFSEIA